VPLRTADLARAAGVHPNTVRRYAERGWLPPVPRGANGYRHFGQEHLDCLRIARIVYGPIYPGRSLRLSARRVLHHAVAGDWPAALARAGDHLATVQAELAQAEAAATLLEKWAAGPPVEPVGPPLPIGRVAHLLGVSVDVLRNWERNGFVAVPRDPANGYRRYGPAEISRLRVIRGLSRAGYSQMAILRMLLQLNRGQTAGLRHSLDTPTPGEDVYVASDRWLSTLAEQERIAHQLVALVESCLAGRSPR
jgi:DNA-binding transcriptional MerR regulator